MNLRNFKLRIVEMPEVTSCQLLLSFAANQQKPMEPAHTETRTATRKQEQINNRNSNFSIHELKQDEGRCQQIETTLGSLSLLISFYIHVPNKLQRFSKSHWAAKNVMFGQPHRTAVTAVVGGIFRDPKCTQLQQMFTLLGTNISPFPVWCDTSVPRRVDSSTRPLLFMNFPVVYVLC